MVSSFSLLLFVLGVVSLGTSASAQPSILDRFTYEDTTTIRSDGYHDYAPQDWNTIACPTSKNNNHNNQVVDDECIAYHDKWHTGKPHS